jgi:hypothetical protein
MQLDWFDLKSRFARLSIEVCRMTKRGYDNIYCVRVVLFLKTETHQWMFALCQKMFQWIWKNANHQTRACAMTKCYHTHYKTMTEKEAI